MNSAQQMLMGMEFFSKLVKADIIRNEAEHLWLVALEDKDRFIRNMEQQIKAQVRGD